MSRACFFVNARRIGMQAAVIMVVGWAPAVHGQSTPPNAPGSREAQVDAQFAVYTAPGSPGAAVGIYRQGKPLYAKGYGLADLEHRVPITPDTVFNLASVSKQFTAFSIALLAREGKLDLKADIRTYLPALADTGEPITVEQLVHHLSGLREYIGLGKLAGYDGSSLLRQAQAVKVLARQRALNFKPGTQYEYSNSGYALLAEIVKAVSGQSLRQFEHERIFKPLGMEHTQVRDSLNEVITDYAVGYQKGRGDVPWTRGVYNRETVGPGNVVSTIGDLGKWGANFVHPTVGDAALIGQLTAPVRMANGAALNYGFGLYQQNFAGHSAIAHTGSVPGVATMFTVFPKEDLTVVVLANVAANIPALTEQIAAIYLGMGKDAAPPTPAVIKPTAEQLTALAGHYQTQTDPMLSLEVKNGGLEGRTATGSSGAVTFWADGTFGFDRYDGPRFRPVRSTTGTVTALKVTGGEGSAPAYGKPYQRVTPATPSATALQSLVGNYHSQELDRTYSLTVESGRLTLRTLWITEGQVLIPASADRFDGVEGPLAGISLTVKRDTRGTPMQLLLHDNSIASLPLDKVAARGRSSTSF